MVGINVSNTGVIAPTSDGGGGSGASSGGGGEIRGVLWQMISGYDPVGE